MLDAEPIERTAHLGEALPIDRFAGLGGVKIMAAPIGVEARGQAVRREHLKEALECRGGPFLIDQEGRVDGARRVVHGDDQIKRRLPIEPSRPRTVLVQHHAFAGLAFAFAPMGAAPFRSLHQARRMQLGLHPRVAPPEQKTGQLVCHLTRTTRVLTTLVPRPACSFVHEPI